MKPENKKPTENYPNRYKSVLGISRKVPTLGVKLPENLYDLVVATYWDKDSSLGDRPIFLRRAIIRQLILDGVLEPADNPYPELFEPEKEKVHSNCGADHSDE